MHAGFVNAGGILLARFAPAFTLDPLVLLVVAAVGATSALLGKMMRSVQASVKGQLGCSTVGQMGFMIMQAGLGFFAAALTHLSLHGFYKAYRFLGSSEQVDRRPPDDEQGSIGPLGPVVAVASALAGGAIFVGLTGKGLHLDAGLLLAGLVVLTTFEAARTGLQETQLSARLRYGLLPLVFLPAVAAYGLVYNAMSATMAAVPAITSPTSWTIAHTALGGAFLLAYLAVETGAHRHSRRLYVWLLNRGQPRPGTVLTGREDRDDR
jgi:NAD(P)H-quinone oxidoreductase subunit 5